MAVMASNGPSPHSPSLRLGLPAPQPSRRHHAQSLLGPSFYDPRTHHVLKSHPEQSHLSSATTMSDDTLSAHTPPLHCDEHIELPAKILDYFSPSNKSNINQSLSCSLQPLLKLSFLSLRPSLLQFVSIVSLLLSHGNLIFEPVCVFLPFPLLPLLF